MQGRELRAGWCPCGCMPLAPLFAGMAQRPATRRDTRPNRCRSHVHCSSSDARFGKSSFLLRPGQIVGRRLDCGHGPVATLSSGLCMPASPQIQAARAGSGRYWSTNSGVCRNLVEWSGHLRLAPNRAGASDSPPILRRANGASPRRSRCRHRAQRFRGELRFSRYRTGKCRTVRGSWRVAEQGGL